MIYTYLCLYYTTNHIFYTSGRDAVLSVIVPTRDRNDWLYGLFSISLALGTENAINTRRCECCCLRRSTNDGLVFSSPWRFCGRRWAVTDRRFPFFSLLKSLVIFTEPVVSTIGFWTVVVPSRERYSIRQNRRRRRRLSGSSWARPV